MGSLVDRRIESNHKHLRSLLAGLNSEQRREAYAFLAGYLVGYVPEKVMLDACASARAILPIQRPARTGGPRDGK